MDLGAFSVSLTVKDLKASLSCYETPGFTVFHGAAERGWLILRSGTATIGLLQSMFERNILTFTPGWDAEAQPVGAFTDVRKLQRRLKTQGVEFQSKADPVHDRPSLVRRRRPRRQPHPRRPARLTPVRPGATTESEPAALEVDSYPVEERMKHSSAVAGEPPN